MALCVHDVKDDWDGSWLIRCNGGFTYVLGSWRHRAQLRGQATRGLRRFRVDALVRRHVSTPTDFAHLTRVRSAGMIAVTTKKCAASGWDIIHKAADPPNCCQSGRLTFIVLSLRSADQINGRLSTAWLEAAAFLLASAAQPATATRVIQKGESSRCQPIRCSNYSTAGRWAS